MAVIETDSVNPNCGNATKLLIYIIMLFLK